MLLQAVSNSTRKWHLTQSYLILNSSVINNSNEGNPAHTTLIASLCSVAFCETFAKKSAIFTSLPSMSSFSNSSLECNREMSHTTENRVRIFCISSSSVIYSSAGPWMVMICFQVCQPRSKWEPGSRLDVRWGEWTSNGPSERKLLKRAVCRIRHVHVVGRWHPNLNLHVYTRSSLS